MKLKDVCVIMFSIPEKNKKLATKEEYWVTQADLKENNIITFNKSANNFDLSTCLNPIRNDILLKRNNPTYVNVYESDKVVYLGNNILILRPINIDPYYLAFVVEQKLNKLNALTNNATVSKAINRVMLEDIEIENVNELRQKVIGQVWALNKKRMQLMERLIVNEKLKQSIFEQKLIKFLGENRND